MNAALPYRPEIDGLRALAVMLVVLFHLNVPFISGGFIGVDVFFVISGFLITSIIAKDMAAGQFTLLQFYERRVLRIFPALFVVLAASFVAAFLLLLPSDLAYFGQSFSAAAASFSNILFWLKSGYFEEDAAYIPLLHTWSLAVEEQFYIVFPLLLMGFIKRRNNLIWLLPLLFLASLTAAQLLLKEQAALSFYAIITRAWELLAGAILALLVPQNNLKPALNRAMAVMGALAIIVSAFTYDKATPFPALAALPPVLGATFIIYAGGNGGFVTRILSSLPAVFIGRISYSLYLWHWPVIVFASYAAASQPMGAQIPFLLFIIFALSVFSWKYVETPARRQTHWRGLKLLNAAVLATAVLVTAGLFLAYAKGLPQRFDAATLRYTKIELGAHSTPINGFALPAYGRLVARAQKAPELALWGDSHSLALAPALVKAAAGRGSFYHFNVSACLPLIKPHKLMESDCNALNKAAFEFIKQHPEIKRVVLAARWSAYHKRFEKAEKRGKIKKEQGFEEAMRELISTLTTLGIEVTVVREVPEAPSKKMALYLTRFAGDESKNSIDMAAHLKQQEGVAKIFSRLPQQFEQVDPTTTLCQRQRCKLLYQGSAVYYDDDHLSAAGAQILAPLFISLFHNLKR